MAVFDDAQKLYAAIIARSTGGQVQSVGAKGRTVSYANAGDVNEMIKTYRMLRGLCTEAEQALLPDLKPNDQAATHGRPAVFFGRPYA